MDETPVFMKNVGDMFGGEIDKNLLWGFVLSSGLLVVGSVEQVMIQSNGEPITIKVRSEPISKEIEIPWVAIQYITYEGDING